MTAPLPTPSRAALERLSLLFSPIYTLNDPHVEGLEHLDQSRPALYVCNHTLLGMIDVPFLFFSLFRSKGIALRGLGDRAHFKIPGWRDLLEAIGVVEGNRANCTELMRAGEHVLVYPGGAREVFKAKDEKYKLIWKERVGFAKMALEHGYAVVPVSAVGGEECFDIHLDRNDLLKTPLGKLWKGLGLREDSIPPLVTGWGLTPLPKPERFYFKFGKPIDASRYAGPDQEAAALRLRDDVAAEVEKGIEELLALRAAKA